MTDPPDVAGPAPARPRTVRLLAGIGALVLVADVLTKVVAVARLEDREPVELLGGAVYLVLVRNPGAAFSLATGYTWVLSLVAVAVVVAILRIARRLRCPGWAVALGLILGGALGNLVDRIFRSPGPLRGHVVDVVSLFAPDGSVWPVFNLADSAIVSGGVLLVLLALTGRELDGTRAGAREPEGAAERRDAAGPRDTGPGDTGPRDTAEPRDAAAPGDAPQARDAAEPATVDSAGSTRSDAGGEGGR